jgi:putative serine protease PepD
MSIDTSYQPPIAPPASPTKPPKRRSGGATAALIAAALFVGAIFGAGIGTLVDDNNAVVAEESTVQQTTTEQASSAEQLAPGDEATTAVQTLPAVTGEVDAAAVGEAVIPSVVTVQVGSTQSGEFVIAASGSGVVYDDQHIITNNHVVEGASAVQVVLSDGRVYQADVVGTDPITDVAVISVATPDLKPITLGSTSELTIGAPAIAVGSPLGLEGGPSLSVGVISALGREVQTTPEVILYGMIQTDAPITNGSSGGALVDGKGDLIGITTAVGASQLGIEGVGFATPVEIVARVADDIIATGSASNSFLGILGSTAFESVGNDGVAPIGVTVEEVTAGSAADQAGFQAGDVITAAGGTNVRTMDELITVLRHYRAGDSVTFDFADANSITLQLGAR